MRSPKQLPFANIVPFPSAAAVSPGLRRVAHDVAETAFSRAPSYDEDGSFPADDINKLYETQLLAATLPPGLGGVGLNGDALSEVLQIIGWGAYLSADYSRDTSRRSAHPSPWCSDTDQEIRRGNMPRDAAWRLEHRRPKRPAPH